MRLARTGEWRGWNLRFDVLQPASAIEITSLNQQMLPAEIPDAVHLLDNGHGVAIIAVWREAIPHPGELKELAELRWFCRRAASHRALVIRADPLEDLRDLNLAPGALSEARKQFVIQCQLCCPEHMAGGTETCYSASTKQEMAAILLKLHGSERRLLDHLALNSVAPGLAGMAKVIAECLPQY